MTDLPGTPVTQAQLDATAARLAEKSLNRLNVGNTQGITQQQWMKQRNLGPFDRNDHQGVVVKRARVERHKIVEKNKKKARAVEQKNNKPSKKFEAIDSNLSRERWARARAIEQKAANERAARANKNARAKAKRLRDQYKATPKAKATAKAKQTDRKQAKHDPYGRYSDWEDNQNKLERERAERMSNF